MVILDDSHPSALDHANKLHVCIAIYFDTGHYLNAALEYFLVVFHWFRNLDLLKISSALRITCPCNIYLLKLSYTVRGIHTFFLIFDPMHIVGIRYNRLAEAALSLTSIKGASTFASFFKNFVCAHYSF